MEELLLREASESQETTLSLHGPGMFSVLYLILLNVAISCVFPLSLGFISLKIRGVIIILEMLGHL